MPANPTNASTPGAGKYRTSTLRVSSVMLFDMLAKFSWKRGKMLPVGGTIHL
jgi:hypothetical protein